MKNKTVKVQDRVRDHSSEAINTEIDKSIEERIKHYSSKSKEEISARISELDREWDIERVLESNAAALALIGLLLGTKRNKKWFFLTGVTAAFLLQHAIKGWCPPVPLLRKLKCRTRQEIDKEKYALKVLRGDFDKIADISLIDISEKSSYALDAVK